MAASASPPSPSQTSTISAHRGSWADPRPTGPSAGSRPAARGAFRHIKDIIRDARPVLPEDASLTQYLAEAESCVNDSWDQLGVGRPVPAFKEYLKACEIAINFIPRHKEYSSWNVTNRAWSLRYKMLRLKLTQMDGEMKAVRELIEDNNARYGTKPRSMEPRQVYDSGFGVPTHVSTTVEPRPLSSSSMATSTPRSSEVPEALRIGGPRPLNRPKPENLRGHRVEESANELSQRFARLRGGESRADSMLILTMPRASDFQPSSSDRPRSYAQPSSGFANGVSQPRGPHDLAPQHNGPSVPPKLPVSASMAMPKPPSPTYSPTNAPTGGLASSANRVSMDGSRPPTERKNLYYVQSHNGSTNSLQRTRDELLLPYRPTTPNGVNSVIVPKSRSSDIPHKTMIDAATLHEYMTKYNVLVVDIRDRVIFDDGHIMASSVICIEPISLKEGVSAEELEDRLVLAPDSEQTLFSRRNEFDIVVYYDQDTSDIAYLKGPPTMTKTPALRAFYDTLYEFNDTKPLKDGRPPALLEGGIDAWIDYMGVHSLARSQTAAMLGSTRQRLATGPGRPITRQRLVSANSRYEVRNRRLRDHKFLDEKEQQAWRQQAQEEEVAPNESVEPGSDGEYSVVDEEPEPSSPFVPDYETFLRRFPSIGQQQSMILPPRRPLPPGPVSYEPPLPAVPARPPPAVPRPSYSGQAEISPPQAPLARATSATRQPIYSSIHSMRTKKLPRTGLTNFGVTCYMNSTLQCLSATLPLSQFFNDRIYESYVQQNWKGSNGIMPKIYANVVQSVWKDDVQVIKPSTFRNFCGRMNREWVIDRQQDAKEFFDFLVDCLHEDLNVNWERTPLRPLTTAEEKQRERMAIAKASPIEWQRYEHRDYSYISSLFAGQHASRLRCRTCNNTSTTYEAFYSISIEIPRSGVGHIYDCLLSYTREEKLSEQWRCPYCKCERQATKQIILTRLPQFLVIHFKRFAASKTEKAKKIHTPIDFPLYGLSMDDFVIPRTTTLPDPHGKIDAATTPPYSYDAYGVLRHLGNSGDGGHYMSIVKDPGRGCWRKFDDERHIDLDPMKLSSRDRLTNGEAYIVFYQRAPAR